MAHRTYRLIIGPETAPDIRRVVELDGRSSLGQLHAFILHAFGLPPGRELYGFALNGRFDDDKGLYVGPGAEGQKAERALLFRLGLHAGKSFDYLLDAGAGLRFKLNVVSVSDAAEPLVEPVLVESLGTLPPETLTAEDVHQSDPDDVAELVPPAEAFLDAHDELEPFDQELTTLRARLEPWEHEDAGEGAARDDEQVPPLALSLLQTAADAALALLPLVAEDLPRFLRLDHWLIERSLGQRLLDLPLELSAVGEHERALAVSKAITFIDPELTRGDTAIVLARAGRREEALAQLDANLDDAKDKSLVEAKAGDTYRALGDLVAAEAYYRRSLAEAETDFDRRQAVLRIVSCLLDTGRAGEASQLLAAERARTPADDSLPSLTAATPAGRNDPCPCGSGKKYKKCHGYG